jgi:hypothetical protein
MKGEYKMKLFRNIKYIVAVCISIMLMPIWASADNVFPDPDTYLPRPDELGKYKKVIDDPRSLMDSLHPSKMLPPEAWGQLQYDVEKMKSLWAELVGFKAPDVVGKIAPEIKPGKYTYKDLDKYPGLKKLMMPEMLNRIKAGEPPFAGNIPEFEIIPTRQYYWALPVAEMTKKNLGKTKLDENGYFIDETWEGGVPFPRPSGKFKAQQVLYDYKKRYAYYGNNYSFMGRALGVDKRMNVDFDCIYRVDVARMSRRILAPPYGYLDKRAEKNGEYKALMSVLSTPRDLKGLSVLTSIYNDANKFNQNMTYVPSIRRVRKMSATDTQDPMNGQDLIYDDNEGFSQKITPHRYPYTFEIIEEREYLVPISIDGTEYVDSKDGYTLKNVKMQRRPCYVLQLTQQDPNYVYSKRIFYIDKEVLMLTGFMQNYDQKGRLYRSSLTIMGFLPESGMFIANGAPTIQRDHIDKHSSCIQLFSAPAVWKRDRFSLKRMMKAAK